MSWKRSARYRLILCGSGAIPGAPSRRARVVLNAARRPSSSASCFMRASEKPILASAPATFRMRVELRLTRLGGGALAGPDGALHEAVERAGRLGAGEVDAAVRGGER